MAKPSSISIPEYNLRATFDVLQCNSIEAKVYKDVAVIAWRKFVDLSGAIQWAKAIMHDEVLLSERQKNG